MIFDYNVIWDSMPLYLSGLLETLKLLGISLFFGLLVAIPLGLMRVSKSSWVNFPAWLYTYVIRGTPMLVQLFLIFYGLPSAGITLDAFTAAVIGFTLNVGAYSSEIIRATLDAVPRGQWEAAHSIGMNWFQAMRRIVVPQAARIAVPPLSNTFIALVKDTSLAAAVTVPELFQSAQRIAAATYEPLILYVETALIYLLFSSVLSALQNKLENRLNRDQGARGGRE